jgi:hypothetical protein
MCLDAASSRAAMFTFGERYVASTLSREPTAPSIAHPMCSPKPMFTQKPGCAACTRQALPLCRRGIEQWSRRCLPIAAPSGAVGTAFYPRRHGIPRGIGYPIRSHHRFGVSAGSFLQLLVVGVLLQLVAVGHLPVAQVARASRARMGPVALQRGLAASPRSRCGRSCGALRPQSPPRLRTACRRAQTPRLRPSCSADSVQCCAR